MLGNMTSTRKYAIETGVIAYLGVMPCCVTQSKLQKCTIMNDKQLTSFTIFDVDVLCLYGIHRTKRRHGMLFKQQ